MAGASSRVSPASSDNNSPVYSPTTISPMLCSSYVQVVELFELFARTGQTVAAVRCAWRNLCFLVIFIGACRSRGGHGTITAAVIGCLAGAAAMVTAFTVIDDFQVISGIILGAERAKQRTQALRR